MKLFGRSSSHSIPIFGIYYLLGVTDINEALKLILEFTKPEWAKKIALYLQVSIFKYHIIENIVEYIWKKWNLANFSETAMPVLPSLLRSNKPKKLKKFQTEEKGETNQALPTLREIPYEAKKKIIIVFRID